MEQVIEKTKRVKKPQAKGENTMEQVIKDFIIKTEEMNRLKKQVEEARSEIINDAVVQKLDKVNYEVPEGVVNVTFTQAWESFKPGQVPEEVSEVYEEKEEGKASLSGEIAEIVNDLIHYLVKEDNLKMKNIQIFQEAFREFVMERSMDMELFAISSKMVANKEKAEETKEAMRPYQVKRITIKHPLDN